MDRVYTRLEDACDLFRERSFATCIRDITLLPPEVLGIIFEFAVSAQDQPLEMALNLSHVCASWRNLAINTPRLWNTIELGDSVDMVQTLLERSKIAPLHIRLNPQYYGDWHDDGTSSLRQSLAAAGAQGERWQSFSADDLDNLESHQKQMLQTQLQAIDTPNLEHITVPTTQYITFPSLPALRSLELTNVLDDNIFLKSFSNNLTHFSHVINDGSFLNLGFNLF